MSHTHNHLETFGKNLLISMLINLLVPVLQIVGGIFSGSMALISDAIHNLGDFTALLVAYVAHRLSKTKPSMRHTFGLQRVEIFAAAINGALLGGTAVFIAVEATGRLFHPTPVAVNVVAGFALIGILGNGLSAWLLHQNSKHNLNARGAFLHMIGDLLTSVAVLLGALVMHFWDAPWLDSVLSLMIVVYIAVNCFALLKSAMHVLMDATPVGLDLNAVKEHLELLEDVSAIHYLHVWSMGNTSIAMTCHVVIPDQLISEAEKKGDIIRKELLEKFGIDHPVLQFETKTCGQGTLLCQMSCSSDGECESIFSP